MVDTQPTSRIAERGQGMWDVRRAETRRSRGKRIGRELLHTGKKQTPDWGGVASIHVWAYELPTRGWSVT